VRRTETDHGLTLTAYAGTNGVHLAWDADESLRANLLGFAIKRFGGSHPEGAWLQGGIGFPQQEHPPGDFLDTHLAPIQAFRWGDYTARPGTEYRYELTPMFAPWDGLQPGDTVATTVTTETVDLPPHSVAFNRAVAASQAYSRRFGDDDPHDNADARAWLGRGLDDFIVGYIARAGAGDALDVVIYEYELETIRQALLAAAGRGAAVRIVYHAAAGDSDQTPVNTANIGADAWPDVDLRPRLTSAICHDKTVVLSRLANGERQPQAVLTGSTNWTFNGLYYQGNVSHVVDDPALAARYLAVFEQLFGGATQGDMRTWLGANDPVPDPADRSLQLLVSPRHDRSDLDYYVSLIGQANRSLLFATAFALDDKVLTALAGDGDGARRVLRYGLQNSASRVTGYNRDLARDFTATGRLTSAPDRFLRERTPGQKGNILIHSKVILIDFDTAQPTVVTGSANYSHGSSQENDENTIVVRDDTRVADVYLTEVFRLFDHYRFRYNWAHPAGGDGGAVTRRVALDDTPAWADKYYTDASDPHVLERQQLSRPLTDPAPTP